MARVICYKLRAIIDDPIEKQHLSINNNYFMYSGIGWSNVIGICA